MAASRLRSVASIHAASRWTTAALDAGAEVRLERERQARCRVAHDRRAHGRRAVDLAAHALADLHARRALGLEEVAHGVARGLLGRALAVVDGHGLAALGALDGGDLVAQRLVGAAVEVDRVLEVERGRDLGRHDSPEVEGEPGLPGGRGAPETRPRAFATRFGTPRRDSRTRPTLWRTGAGDSVAGGACDRQPERCAARRRRAPRSRSR